MAIEKVTICRNQNYSLSLLEQLLAESKDLAHLPAEINGTEVIKILRSDGYLNITELAEKSAIAPTSIECLLRVLEKNPTKKIRLVEYKTSSENKHRQYLFSPQEADKLEKKRHFKSPREFIGKLEPEQYYTITELGQIWEVPYCTIDRYVREGLPFHQKIWKKKAVKDFLGKEVEEYLVRMSTFWPISLTAQKTGLSEYVIKKIIAQGIIQPTYLGKKKSAYIEERDFPLLKKATEDYISNQNISNHKKHRSKFSYTMKEKSNGAEIFERARLLVARTSGQTLTEISLETVLTYFLSTKELYKDKQTREHERRILSRLALDEYESIRQKYQPQRKRRGDFQLASDNIEETCSKGIKRMLDSEILPSYLERIMDNNNPAKIMTELRELVAGCLAKNPKDIYDLTVLDFVIRKTFLIKNKETSRLETELFKSLPEEQREVLLSAQSNPQVASGEKRELYLQGLKTMLKTTATYKYLARVLLENK